MSFSRLSILKFVELAITCACVGIHYHSYNAEPDVGMLVTGTFIGFLIIFAGGALGYVLSTPSGKRVDVFFSLIGCALFVASGAVLVDKFQHSSGDWRDKNMAKGALAIINGGLLLIDAVLTHRGA